MSLLKRGLGRGFSSLISDYDNSDFEAEKLAETGTSVQEIDINRISPNPNQPRKVFDQEALQELAASIESHGILQPIIVEEVSDKTYVLIAGERRLRAAKLAGLKKVPCLVRTFSALQRIEVALIENIQREGLNPVEEARAYHYLVSTQGIKQDELAVRLGKSRPAVTNTLRLLNLPSEMLDSLSTGKISSGHARALLSVESPADRQVLFDKIISMQMSVRQAEEYAGQLNRGIRAANSLKTNEKSEKTESIKDEEIAIVEEKFLSLYGCKVIIKGKLTKGKIQIPFKNSDELDRIYRLLSKGQPLFDMEEE